MLQVSINKTDPHDITDILFKVASNNITPPLIFEKVTLPNNKNNKLSFLMSQELSDFLWNNEKDTF